MLPGAEYYLFLWQFRGRCPLSGLRDSLEAAESEESLQHLEPRQTCLYQLNNTLIVIKILLASLL